MPKPTPRRHLGLHPRSDDRGIAMIMTILVMMIITTLLILITSEGVEALPLARQNQNYQSALQAAEAGVQDYVSRLDANTAYYLNTTDSSNKAMNGGWVQVCPISAGGTCAATNVQEYYSYAVNSTGTESNGTVYLTVTGAAGGNPATCGCHPTFRTIKESVSLSANDNSLYYTQYEETDPNFVSGFTPPTGETGTYAQFCKYDVWQENSYLYSTYGQTTYGPDENNNTCLGYKIFFGTSDTLNGKIESNDEINVCGTPSFPYGVTSTYDQSTTTPGGSFGGVGAYYNGCGGSGPTYCTASNSGCTAANQPAGSSSISRPATNSQLLQDLATSQDGGGCYYQGPITVTLNPNGGSSTGGTMTVKLDGYGSSAATTSTTPATGITSVGASSCVGTNIAFPPNGLIYDDNETGCGTAVCQADVFVSGTNASGPLTIASNNNITITDNIQDASTSSTSPDVTGLWAQQSILYPDSYSDIPSTTTTANSVLPMVDNLTVDAAMVSLSDSIYLPCYTTDNGQTIQGSYPTASICPTSTNSPSTQDGTIQGAVSPSLTSTCNGSTVSNPSVTPGNMGFLTVCGSLSQEFRGPVATSSGGSPDSGYSKDYIWDSRLQYLQPPYFNAVTSPNWNPTNFIECNAVQNPASATC